MSLISRSVEAVADGADDGVEADALELVQIGLGAYPVVAEEHHGFLAQFVSYVDHFPWRSAATSRRWKAMKSLYSFVGTRYWLL